MELRIALESVLLAGDSGNSPEIQFRIATRGHGFSGTLMTSAKPASIPSGKAYGLASSILHGRGLKRKNREEDAGTVGRAQELCREALLRMVREGALPNWDEVVLGKGYRFEA